MTPDSSCAGDKSAARLPTSVDRPTANARLWFVGGCCLLVALVCLAFGGAVTHDFVAWDDGPLIKENACVTPFTLHGLTKVWAGPHLGMYLPLVYNLWAVLAWVGLGANGEISATPFHVANIIVHGVNCILVFALIATVTSRRLLALAAAMLFAVHPLQVEAVAWATAMKDLLSSMLALGSMLAYVTASRSFSVAPRRNLHAHVMYSLSMLLLLFATFAKPGVVGAPLMLAIIDTVFLKTRWTLVAMRLAPHCLIALGAAVWTSLSHPVVPDFIILPWALRPSIASHALAHYLQKALWPIDLTIDYALRPDWVIQSPAFIWLAIIPPLIAAALLMIGRRHRVYLWTYLLFIAGIFPLLGFVPFIYQFRSTVADRYLYLSMVAVGLGFAYLVCSARSRLAIAVLSVVIPSMIVLSARQCAHWKDSFALFARATELSPRSAVANGNLGSALLQEHKRAKNGLGGSASDAQRNEISSMLGMANEFTMRSLAAEPKVNVVFNNLVVIRIEQERYSEALALATFAERYCRALNARIPPALTAAQIALAYVHLGDEKNAVKWLEVHVRANGLDMQTKEVVAKLLKRAAATQPTDAERHDE